MLEYLRFLLGRRLAYESVRHALRDDDHWLWWEWLAFDGMWTGLVVPAVSACLAAWSASAPVGLRLAGGFFGPTPEVMDKTGMATLGVAIGVAMLVGGLAVGTYTRIVFMVASASEEKEGCHKRCDAERPPRMDLKSLVGMLNLRLRRAWELAYIWEGVNMPGEALWWGGVCY